MNEAPATVSRHVVVNATVAEAFATFTEHFGDFKPKEHNILGVEIIDGSECRWARVLVYEPPHRVVFSWDIGPTWQVQSDLASTSEVEVRFEPDGVRTRVELEHRHLDRHGPGWENIASGVGNDQGWPLYLDRYASLFAPDDGSGSG
jgi:uncharacterized protein YndB with AHSA1/START domain